MLERDGGAGRTRWVGRRRAESLRVSQRSVREVACTIHSWAYSWPSCWGELRAFDFTLPTVRSSLARRKPVCSSAFRFLLCSCFPSLCFLVDVDGCCFFFRRISSLLLYHAELQGVVRSRRQQRLLWSPMGSGGRHSRCQDFLKPGRRRLKLR